MTDQVQDPCADCVLSRISGGLCDKHQGIANPVQNPCENCGSNDWTHATPGGSKGALTRVVTDDPGGGLAFVPTSGTPVDLYFCQACGLIRLFGVRG